MACICHPPSSAWVTPLARPRKRLPRPTGSSQPTLRATLCGMSKLEIAFSRPWLPPTEGLFWVVMLLENVYETRYQRPFEARRTRVDWSEWYVLDMFVSKYAMPPKTG